MSAEFPSQRKDQILAASPLLRQLLFSQATGKHVYARAENVMSGIRVAGGFDEGTAFFDKYVEPLVKNALQRGILSIHQPRLRQCVIVPTLIGYEVRDIEALDLFVDITVRMLQAQTGLIVTEANSERVEKWVRGVMKQGANWRNKIDNNPFTSFINSLDI